MMQKVYFHVPKCTVKPDPIWDLKWNYGPIIIRNSPILFSPDVCNNYVCHTFVRHQSGAYTGFYLHFFLAILFPFTWVQSNLQSSMYLMIVTKSRLF